MRPFIVVGDKAANGAVVATGAATADIQGKPIARLGDKVICPDQCNRGSCTIISGDSMIIVEGKPVACQGDKTGCGAPLIASQMQTHASGA